MMNLNQLHALTTDRGKENFKKFQNEKKYQQHTEEPLYTKLHYTQIVSKIFFIPNRFAAENIAFSSLKQTKKQSSPSSLPVLYPCLKSQVLALTFVYFKM